MDTPSPPIGGRRSAALTCALPCCLVLLWTIELSAVQFLGTERIFGVDSLDATKDLIRRSVFNLLFASALIGLLPRLALIVVFIGYFVLANVVYSYFCYFERPLSWFTIAGQWTEGVAVADHAVTLIKLPFLLAALLLLVLKCYLVGCKCVPLRRSLLPSVLGGIALLLFCSCSFVFVKYYKPINSIRLASPQYIYGFGIAWVAEAVTWDKESLLREANAKAVETSDNLDGVQPTLKLCSKIVIVQVESLDFDAIESRHETELVMPYLNSLCQQSMFYEVLPIHETGSSDADFSLLTGKRPNGKVAAYRVEGFSYENSLPHLAASLGYKTVAMHGNTGAFYQRKPAFEQMGFDEIYFAEDLTRHGVNGQFDHELFEFSSKLIHSTDEPSLHFLITISSHGPFTNLPRSYENILDAPKGSSGSYVNCMRYVDNALRSYIESLPDDTLVVIYGDHGSGVYDYESLTEKDGYVPWIIHQTGRNLATVQNPSTWVSERNQSSFDWENQGESDSGLFANEWFSEQSAFSNIGGADPQAETSTADATGRAAESLTWGQSKAGQPKAASSLRLGQLDMATFVRRHFVEATDSSTQFMASRQNQDLNRVTSDSLGKSLEASLEQVNAVQAVQIAEGGSGTGILRR